MARRHKLRKESRITVFSWVEYLNRYEQWERQYQNYMCILIQGAFYSHFSSDLFTIICDSSAKLKKVHIHWIRKVFSLLVRKFQYLNINKLLQRKGIQRISLYYLIESWLEILLQPIYITVKQKVFLFKHRWSKSRKHLQNNLHCMLKSFKCQHPVYSKDNSM